MIFGPNANFSVSIGQSSNNGWCLHSAGILWINILRHINAISNLDSLYVDPSDSTSDTNSRKPWSYGEFSFIFIRVVIRCRGPKIGGRRETPVVFSTIYSSMIKSQFCIGIPLSNTIGSQRTLERTNSTFGNELCELDEAKQILTTQYEGRNGIMVKERDNFHDLIGSPLLGLMVQILLLSLLKNFFMYLYLL